MNNALLKAHNIKSNIKIFIKNTLLKNKAFLEFYVLAQELLIFFKVLKSMKQYAINMK